MNSGRFKKGTVSPMRGVTSRINMCVECGIKFVRKTPVNGKPNTFSYSKVKYCDEHKYLSFGKSGKPGKKNDALKIWRENGGKSWNIGKKMPVDTVNKMKEKLKGRKVWNKGLVGVQQGWNKGLTHLIDSRICGGSKSPRWKGGVTPQNRMERAKFRETMQKQVLERDNYTCQICGARGCALQVDHIQPWAEYVEGRFEMNNCRTLCQSCHYKITFGREMPEGIKWGHSYKYFGREVN